MKVEFYPYTLTIFEWLKLLFTLQGLEKKKKKSEFLLCDIGS